MTEHSVEGLLREFAARRLSPVEVLDACAARIEAVDGARRRLHGALPGAGARGGGRGRGGVGARRGAPARGDPVRGQGPVRLRGRAHGVRLADVRRRTCRTRDAEAVARARAAGAILVGKTQTHEFAWGITSVNELMGTAHNPWALERVSGGSSGGSAVVLAAGEVPLALGSDTGGSIRVPAAFCGIVGLKPTYGRISAARRLAARPLARPSRGRWRRRPPTRRCCSRRSPVSTPADPATGRRAARRRARRAPPRARRARRRHSAPTSSSSRSPPTSAPSSSATVRTLEAAGARLVEVALPEARARSSRPSGRSRAPRRSTRTGAPASTRRGATSTAPTCSAGSRPPSEVTLEQYLARVRRPRSASAPAFARLFRSCDVLLTPVSAGSPLPIGEETVVHEGVELTFRELVMSYTTPQDLVGLPACAVRAGFDALGIPVGVQFTAPPWQEGACCGRRRGSSTRRPTSRRRRPVALALAERVRRQPLYVITASP